jgi:hypothetical protein
MGHMGLMGKAALIANLKPVASKFISKSGLEFFKSEGRSRKQLSNFFRGGKQGRPGSLRGQGARI